ncbi:hypothetical protein K493DRAFT_320259 [Basidiobolus meristosporus CBS 931.73]|uniref:UBA domain-containing protein n=1 Tax=Basidiobolus meristosporus CBS 931.73 TaxID=1314790 RepID=A0A1Y1XCH0_9FUNG|nr:hypothetical protein K493DRAFT_320259 [Basidiobolus meristosporus CBS 931.73]|eukprot:ORX83460.1 hypothetical protein K493DRAFT_320259 [Basidiobolus meristosporus CBS 931.73]
MSLMYSALSDVPLTTTLKKKLPKSVKLPSEYAPLPHLKQLLQSAYDFKLERHIVTVADEKRKEEEARAAAQEESRKMVDKEKVDKERARLKAVAPGLSSEGEILQPVPVVSSHGRAASMSPELETRREMSPTLEMLRPASDNKGGKPRNFNYLEFENGLPPANPWDTPKTSEDDLKILEDVLAGAVNQTPHVGLDPDFDPLAPLSSSKSKPSSYKTSQPIIHNGLDVVSDAQAPEFIARSVTELSLSDTSPNHYNLPRSNTYSYGQPLHSSPNPPYRHPSQPHIAPSSQGASYPSHTAKSYYDSHSQLSAPHHSARYTTPGSSKTNHAMPPQLPPKPAKSWYDSETSMPPPIPPLPASLHEDQAENEANVPQVRELVNMGFSKEQAIRALKAHDYDLVKATNYLLDSM